MNKPLQSALLAILIFAINCGSNNAYASALSDFIKQAEVIKVNAFNSATSTAIKVTTTIRGFAANDPYQIKSLDIPKTTYMTRLKAGMGETGGFKGLVKRNAWYAAWFATMAAAGWAIDELTNEVTRPVKVTKYTGKVGQFNNPTYLGGTYSLPDAVSKVIGECTSSGGTFCTSDSVLTLKSSPSTYTFTINYKVNNLSYSKKIDYYVLTINDEIVSSEPVPDDSIYDSIISKMLADPQSAAQAFMVPDPYPYPYPNIFPSQIPYIPGVLESDEQALDWYFKGLLQSTNPNAPYYVTPERYQQIAAMAQQLQQGQTPQGQVDALNNQLKNPLTQKQLEESLKKEREAQDKATKDALGEKPNLDTLLDPYKAFEQDVKSTPNNQVNQLPSNTFSIGGSGQCYTFDKSYSIMGATWTLSTRQFCDAYYYPYFLPILTWFFYCCTGLYIWFSIRDAFARRV